MTGRTEGSFLAKKGTGKSKNAIAIFPTPYCHLAGKIFAVTGRSISINPITTLPAIDIEMRLEN